MKKQLNFVAEWHGDDRKKVWSGTTYSLFEALKQHYDVVDVDVTNHIETRLDEWINRIHGLLHISRLNDGGKRWVRNAGNYVKSLKLSSNLYFQFCEYVDDQKGRKTYCFLDLTTDYLSDLSIRDSGLYAQSNFRNYPPKFFRRRKEYQNRYFRQCAGVFTLAQWTAKDMVNRMGLSPKKVHFVGGGINIDSSNIDYADKTGNKLLFVGRDFERKGGFIVYDSFVELKKRMPQAELYVAGPEENPISNPIEGYHYLGNVKPNDLPALYNKCDVFCLPSYFEPWGIVFAEALAFGLPCIGRNFQDMPYFIDHGKTGFLLDDDDKATLANYMFQLLSNESYAHIVKAQKDYYLQEYCWKNVAQRIFDIIENDGNNN